MGRLKVCFVGIGSIAKRHIRNLCTVCQEKKINLTIDAFRRKKKNVDEDIQNYIGQVFTDGQELPDDYDVIFITNPTSMHLNTLQKLHGKAKHFFIEKPLTSYEKREQVFGIKYRAESVYYVACPLRYTSVIQYLKENIQLSDAISVRCISSSYLPEWRPDVDYRRTYSANRALGGGVSIDLIHEWDYIKFLFGTPDKIFYTSGKKSLLELECEDYAIYVADYSDKVIELHLDYFGRKALREIMIITNDDTVVGDLINNKISYLNRGKEVHFHEDRNEWHKRELEYFLDIIDGKNVCNNSIMDARKTILFTQGEIE
jgi:predicted dehydrogenase